MNACVWTQPLSCLPSFFVIPVFPLFKSKNFSFTYNINKWYIDNVCVWLGVRTCICMYCISTHVRYLDGGFCSVTVSPSLSRTCSSMLAPEDPEKNKTYLPFLMNTVYVYNIIWGSLDSTFMTISKVHLNACGFIINESDISLNTWYFVSRYLYIKFYVLCLYSTSHIIIYKV